MNRDVIERIRSPQLTPAFALQIGYAIARRPEFATLQGVVMDLAKDDSTWDRRYIALSLYIEFARGKTPVYSLLDRMINEAPLSCYRYLYQCAKDAYASRISVLYARTFLATWFYGGPRPFMTPEFRPSVHPAIDAFFLHQATELRAGVELTALVANSIDDAVFTDEVSTSLPLYPAPARGAALSVVTRLISNPSSLFDSTASTAETCLADEILLIASMVSNHVSVRHICHARMHGSIERARVIAAMHAPTYNVRTPIVSFPVRCDVNAGVLTTARRIRSVRDSLANRVSTMSFRPLPPRVMTMLRRAELQLRYDDLDAWYSDLVLVRGARGNLVT